MRCEILTIGDELCRGDIVDTNSSWLARELAALEVTVAWMTSCGDDATDMLHAFVVAVSRADMILVSGGLGPTEDDLTVDLVAEMLGVDVETHEPSRVRLEQRLASVGVDITESTLRQVRVPCGARVLGNPVGLAPAFEVEFQGVPIFCMPGVPREVQAIFREAVTERVLALRQARGEQVERIARRTLRIFGMGESNVSTAMVGLITDHPNATLHYRVPFPEVLLQIVVRDNDADRARQTLERLEFEARARLGHRVYGVDDDSLAAVLGRALARRHATMATAESCTGGLIGALMTEVPGSSEYFMGGAITYSNAEKTRQLGVPEHIFAEHGAVSQACVEAMAAGARERFGVTYAVAVSGIAGPGGGTPGKPVGTVWLGLAGPGGVISKRRQWPGERDRVRTLAAYWAMAMTLYALEEDREHHDP